MEKKGGYGVVYQEVTRNKNIPAPAKGLYAYLASFCGMEDECYPGVEMITKEMGMGKDTFYRHINALVSAGVVEKRQVISDGGKFGRTVYHLTHEVEIKDYPYTEKGGFPYTDNTGFPFPQNEDTDRPDTVHKETNNNTNNNNTNNNNNKTYTAHFETLWKAYPRKKEKARAYKCYKARLNDGYSEDELLGAVEKYAEECRMRRTEERFIKLPATFLGANMPFTDYLQSEAVKDGAEGTEESSFRLW